MSWWTRLLGKPTAPTASPAPAPVGQPFALNIDEHPDPVRDAIRAALGQIYGDQEPFHYGAQLAFADGGPDPLDAVSIFWSEHGPHWHYVSFGLAGMIGAELTFRLAATTADRGTEPAKYFGSVAYNAPVWPIAMLNMLARRVHRTQRPFRHGHWWEGGPGALGPLTSFHFLAFARDRELAEISASGRPYELVQAVGVSAQTIAGMQADERAQRGDRTLDALIESSPLLVTPRDHPL